MMSDDGRSQMPKCGEGFGLRGLGLGLGHNRFIPETINNTPLHHFTTSPLHHFNTRHSRLLSTKATRATRTDAEMGRYTKAQ